MVFNKIIICIPPFSEDIPTTPFIGVGYISEFLSINNVEHRVIDMNLGISLKNVIKTIEEFKPDLIGFFLMTRSYKTSYRIIDYIKSKYRIIAVAGGPHVSIFRKKVLEDCNLDYAVKLEGELTLMELISGKDSEDILGLIYRNYEKICENPDRPFMKDLDQLPFPKYDKFDLSKYRDIAISIVSSRGCPFQCIYCPVKAAIGQQFRIRSANNIFKQILYWYKKGYRKFNFQDDNFTLKKERVLKLCHLIISSNMTNLVLSCPNGVRADTLDEEILSYMKKAGFISIAIGVEAGNNKILKSLKKGESIEQIQKSIRLACSMGYDVVLYFLIGAPSETEDDVEDSFKIALKYPITDAYFYNILPYPKTELYQCLKKEKLLLKPLEEYLDKGSPFDLNPYFITNELSLQKRIDLIKKGKKVSKIIRKLGIIRRLKERYGFLGFLLGHFFGSDIIIQGIIKNRYLLRIYTKYLSTLT